MNKEKMEELLNDLHDGVSYQNGIVEIPNAERVIEEAWETGFSAGFDMGWVRHGQKMYPAEPTESLRQPSPLKTVPGIATDTCGHVNKGIVSEPTTGADEAFNAI